MKITLTNNQKLTPVTILHLNGKLDGTNYGSLIEEAQKIYAAGVRDIILDLSKLIWISSAGLGAMHQVALLFRGNKQPEQDESWAAYRWAAYRSIDRDHKRGTQEHVKLFSPTKEVREVLDMIGFSSLFEIFTELDQAISSFHTRALEMESSLR